ncbi:MAG: hypothetical protein LQ338_005063 [Usnochroma carphineum]|nr:MAG: hypothetical protein LQ338_005063 [Usnochroma carphineum]
MSEGICEMEEGIRRGCNMEAMLGIAESTYTAWAIVAGLSVLWHYHVEKLVPRPYLDEFFHIQQAELYLQGRFTEWHPKITTPPGLYLVSLAYLGLLSVTRIIDHVHVADLRRTNLWAAGVLPFHFWFLIHQIVAKYDGFEVNDIALPLMWSMAELNHAILNICLFPPLFFFYGLYYTDVWSVLSVLITFQFYHRKWRKLMVAAGIASLFFRQTNIFWVSIYLGASEAIRQLKQGRLGIEYPSRATVVDVVAGSWRHSCIYDPLISQASFEGTRFLWKRLLRLTPRPDYIKFALSLVAASITGFFQLLPFMRSYLCILGAFGFFVLWNEGVVLGDKENHVASIHLAQMLYIWPYFMFFSFPLLYPYILNASVPQKYIPSPLRTGSTKHQLPRLVVAFPVMALMILIVRFNTIVHPFTLADNRHYTFYVFRLLFRHPSIRYLVVPIYFICAWAAITAFGGLPNVQRPKQPEAAARRTQVRKGSQQRLAPPVHGSIIDRGHRVSTAVIWLIATTLSLVTAPLVEPRYFIVPWLIWRLHLPSSWPTGEEAALKRRKKARTFSARCKAMLYEKHDHRLWLETAWFMFVNWAVGYIFLYWGFEWPQERGKVQRFMW